MDTLVVEPLRYRGLVSRRVLHIRRCAIFAYAVWRALARIVRAIVLYVMKRVMSFILELRNIAVQL